MVFATTTEFLSKSSKTDAKSKFQTIGSVMVILGKLKEWTLNIRFIFTVELERHLMPREFRGVIGKIVKQSSLEPMTPLFQDMQPSIQSLSGYGNLYLSMNSISMHLTEANTIMLCKLGKELNISLVSYTLTIQLKLVRS